MNICHSLTHFIIPYTHISPPCTINLKIWGQRSSDFYNYYDLITINSNYIWVRKLTLYVFNQDANHLIIPVYSTYIFSWDTNPVLGQSILVRFDAKCLTESDKYHVPHVWWNPYLHGKNKLLFPIIVRRYLKKWRFNCSPVPKLAGNRRHWIKSRLRLAINCDRKFRVTRTM